MRNVHCRPIQAVPCRHPERRVGGRMNLGPLSLAVRAATWAVMLAVTTIGTPSARAADAVRFGEDVAPVLQQYCVKCHGAGDSLAGDVNLVTLGNDHLADDLELLGRVVEAVDLEAMPPEDERQLEPQVRTRLLRDLRAVLQATSAQRKRFGHAPIRRMNRFQYNNAVMDLFDLKCIVFTLPERMMREHNGYFQPATGKMADVVRVGSRPLGKSQMIEKRLAGVAAFPQDLRAEHGFDNRGDHLSLSPLLLEAFLKLGQSITQSPDFEPRNVGIWESFFAPPPPADDPVHAARRRLEPFLSRAFRRPVDAERLERYVAFVANQLGDGMPFPAAMKLVAAAAISSPNFFYLYDRTGQTDTAEPIDDFELASRLSFMLWGSLPDQELLDLAAAGNLSDPNTLEEQIERLLRDRKLKRFCDSFPAQWLQLDRIISSVPNRDKFPGFYFSKYRDSMHMMMEPLLLFETVLIENQPITQFLDSSFSYRSPLLEEAYGELATQGDGRPQRGGGGVTVLNFRRVPITDRRAGGVITNAAVMTMTSGPDRTQPITRGAWLAAVIFNNPPAPPPANVPALEEKPPAGQEHLTLRERLASHRERADCKGCHEQIDPLGFALENYNPIGVWREKYENGRDVDMAGTLFRKHAFQNVVEFKDAVLAEKDRFTRALAGHLLAFGLARELSAADQVALQQITAATVADDYRIQTLIREVIMSEPFLTKTNPATANETKTDNERNNETRAPNLHGQGP